MKNNYMDSSDSSDNPIDLSRRCDSVETRKTPSPYNSSTNTETSPTLSTSSQNSSRFPYATQKRKPSSPKELTVHHHHYQSINSNDDDINPYIMHAITLKKLQNIPATVSASGPSSPESDGTNIQYPMIMGRDGKLARPFKAYPRDALTTPFASIPISDPITDRLSAERFTIFRQQALEHIHAANGGRPTITNPKMRRNTMQTYSESEQNSEAEYQQQNNCDVASQAHSDSSDGKKGVKDSAYYERRRKNNAAAKKSRDRRRIKEDEMAIRAAFLERENMTLKIELNTIKQQLAQYVAS